MYIRRVLSVLTTAVVLVGVADRADARDAPAVRRLSDTSPFPADCIVDTPGSINYPNAEVEPWLSVDPDDREHMTAVWQQDRWNDGGARGLAGAVTRDGGRTWTRTFGHFTRCSGGTAANGGDFERASDPWVSIGRDGVAHQIALSFNNTDAREAILYSRSPDGGRTWGEPVTLTSDTSPLAGLDKESITADPKRARFVYATWDRSSTEAGPFTEPTWFTRSTDGGRTWEPVRIIYDPGIDNGTIGNQIVVLPNGDLLNVMAVFVGADIKLAVLRSTDRGATWSAPLFIDDIGTIGITDAKTGEPVRTSDFLPDIAVDPRTGRTYIVWQDARPSGGRRDGIVISSSADGGRTWSSPVQVNGAPQAQAFTPSVDVDRDGKVAVGYYDFRNDSTDPAVLLTNTWLATSRDRGQTFTDRAVGSTFDMRTAPDAGGFFVGDYQGLDHTDEGFAWLYVAANSGDLVNRTDVFISLPGDGGRDTGGGRGEDNNPTPRSARQLLDDHHRRSAR